MSGGKYVRGGWISRGPPPLYKTLYCTVLLYCIVQTMGYQESQLMSGYCAFGTCCCIDLL